MPSSTGPERPPGGDTVLLVHTVCMGDALLPVCTIRDEMFTVSDAILPLCTCTVHLHTLIM